jgi:hypothetical protein
MFEPEAELDREAQASEQDVSVPDATSRSVGGAESQESGETVAAQSASTGRSVGQGEASEEAGGADEPGDEPEGDAPAQDMPGEGEGSADDPSGEGDGPVEDPKEPESSGEDPYGGYNGEVTVYNPNEDFWAEVNDVEHLAVLGGDVAVLAQSLGGAGAICAMNEDAWYGSDAQALSPTTYAHFSDVFSGEFPEGFEESGLLWSGSGSSPGSVKDIDALVSLCGQGGVIVYDQRLGNEKSLFDLDQRKRLQKAEIQLVPVEMSTVQGMLEAAQVIGEALSESSECAEDASAMARAYIDTVNSIVRSVAATNGGYLAAFNGAAATLSSTLLTAYNSPPVSRFLYTKVYGYIATDSESGLSFTSSPNMDVSDIVLFGNNSAYMNTPLSFWMQAAGVWDASVASAAPSTGLRVFWPTEAGQSLTAFSGGRSGGALARWLGTPPPSDATSNYGGQWHAMKGQYSTMLEFKGSGHGLGSSQVPYLIVCASDGKSATQVKDTVVRGMRSYDENGVLTPYSVLPYGPPFTPFATVSGESFESSIGSTNGTTSESPFYLGTEPLAVEDVVRENPTGLLGSWTEGTMESVLEAVWIADIYSRSPDGCDYVPVTNMGSFSVSIGGVTCTSTRDAVLQFYDTFYRCDASAIYGDIVTDEGL